MVEPGDDVGVDFSIPGPLTVPVFFVDDGGLPRSDVFAALRKNPDSGSGSSGRMVVGSDGRVVLRGLPPRQLLQVLGVSIADSGRSSVVGVSEAFVGQPGEILPEITVICEGHGDFQMFLTDSAGNSVAGEKDVLCSGMLDDGTLSEISSERTKADGFLYLHAALPEGSYKEVYFLYRGPEGLEWVVIANVGVAAGAVMDLGQVTGNPVALEAAQGIFGGRTQYLR